MTDQEIIDYYANLLIIQYRGKPKAYATIQALVTPAVMNQILTKVQDAFNVDTAVGVQLDTLGKYAGVKRTANAFGGPVTLDDTDFRQLIKLAIIKNNSGSDLATIQNLIYMFFPGEILVFDFQNMRMQYFFNSTIGSVELAEVFIVSDLLPRPMGVQLSATIYAPFIARFFGFRTYTVPGHNISPFNSYADYQMDRPWLTYAYALIP